MAIPQTDPNPAAPVKLPDELSGSTSTTPSTQTMPVEPAAKPIPEPTPALESMPTPEPAPMQMPAASNEPAIEPTDTGSEYKIEDAPADEPTPVVDLDNEMKTPEEPMAEPAPIAEPPVDPNVALKDGNANVKEGSLEPAPEPITAPEPIPTMTTEDNQIAASKDMATDPVPEKTTLDELPDLAAAAPEEPQMDKMEETPVEPMHETPSQDKLQDIMAAKPEESDGSEMPVESAVSADMKKAKGGSSMVMRIVLLFLLIGILAMSAVLAYLLFA